LRLFECLPMDVQPMPLTIMSASGKIQSSRNSKIHIVRECDLWTGVPEGT
jgi:hypothetical protein